MHFPDEAILVRGGQSTSFLIEKSYARHPNGLVGISVVCSSTSSLEELAKTIPHSFVRVASVADIRRAGGDVISSSGRSPYHATLVGLKTFGIAANLTVRSKQTMDIKDNIPRLFVDFNNADSNGRVRLNTQGTAADLARLGIILSDGIKVYLDDDDEISIFGVVRWSEVEGWVAEVDWDEIRRKRT